MDTSHIMFREGLIRAERILSTGRSVCEDTTSELMNAYSSK